MVAHLINKIDSQFSLLTNPFARGRQLPRRLRYDHPARHRERMPMTEFPVAATRRRRWLVHLIWFAIAVLALYGGVMLGFRIYNATLGMMLLSNGRAERLSEIQADLRLIGDDDITVHRQSEA